MLVVRFGKVQKARHFSVDRVRVPLHQRVPALVSLQQARPPMLELAMVLVVVGAQREHRVPRRRRAVLRVSTTDGTARIAPMHHHKA
jgi:hypothetical protein